MAFKIKFMILLALILCIGLVAVIVAVSVNTVLLTQSGSLSTTERALYATGTTILATLLTSIITSQIQALLLRNLNEDLGNPNGRGLKHLNERWRTSLRINGIFEGLRNIHIVLVYFVAGLITTSIVVSFTPSLTMRTLSFLPFVSSGPNVSNCSGVVRLEVAEFDGRQYYWDLNNGSAFFIPANAGKCPTRQAVTLLGSVNTLNPDVYAYADQGVAVHPSAIGAPITIYSARQDIAPAINEAFSTFGASLANASQCVSVMQRNPIECRRGGTLSMSSQSGQVNVTSAEGLCRWTETFGFDPTTGNTVAKGMCTHGQVGQGTIVIGATGGYAKWLAWEIGDTTTFGNLPTEAAPGSTYVVTCTVDTSSVYTYKVVTLSLQASDIAGSNYARYLHADQACIPAHDTIDWILTATAAAANWQLLRQNAGLDGWIESYADVSEFGAVRGPPYAFSNSLNALEDVMGLIAALVASRVNETLVGAPGTIEVTATRIGTGNTSALLFALPPIFATLILGWLIWRPRESENVDDSTSLSGLIRLGDRFSLATAYDMPALLSRYDSYGMDATGYFGTPYNAITH